HVVLSSTNVGAGNAHTHSHGRASQVRLAVARTRATELVVIVVAQPKLMCLGCCDDVVVVADRLHEGLVLDGMVFEAQDAALRAPRKKQQSANQQNAPRLHLPFSRLMGMSRQLDRSPSSAMSHLITPCCPEPLMCRNLTCPLEPVEAAT